MSTIITVRVGSARFVLLLTTDSQGWPPSLRFHTLAVARRRDRTSMQMGVQRAEEGKGNSNASELGPGHYSLIIIFSEVVRARMSSLPR